MPTKTRAAEIPVKIRNFLRGFFTFCLMVVITKITPNKEKMIKGERNRRVPLKKSVTTGTKNCPKISKKKPINNQKTVIGLIFFI